MTCFPYVKQKMVCLLSLSLLVAAALLPSASAQTKPNVISWGQNMPSWNTKLGVTQMREACSIAPTDCEPYLDNLASESGVSTYYVSFPFDPDTSVSWAKQYSTLSLTHKKMIEIGFDDFVGRIEDDQIDGTLPNPASFITSVIAATKSANPNLAFGVTIYEDGLNHTALTSLPASLRAQIQFVHLFVHYRMDAPNFSANVATAKSLFPNAKIIGGAYPYDRIDYIPCAFKGTVKCTAAQEQSLFQQLLETQLSMVKAGTLSGLEFFFGYFGDPQDWTGWTTQTNACLSSRLSQCYANSETLQSISMSVLQSTAGPAVPPVVSLAHTSLFMGTEIVGKQSTPAKLIMTNTGAGPLTISSIGVTGLNSSEFPLTQNCGTTLPAGTGCTLTIYFKPATTGTRQAQVTISDNAGSGTQTVTLTGTGIPSTTGTPAVSLAHTSLFMGTETVNVKSTPALLIMKNTGTAALAISGVSVTGTNAANFPLTHNCGTTLPAGTGCTITIYFKPSAAGTRAGTVVIKDNAGTGSQTVALTGTGVS